MQTDKYRPRLMQEHFKTVSEIMKIVLICGPRQCGKTTMMRHMLTNKGAFVSFDYPEVAQYAEDSPRSFLNRYLSNGDQLAIDEFQKVPIILGALKAYVDQHEQKGQILLSGSSDFRTSPSVNESMAGRLGEVRLRTFTEAEKVGFSNSLLERLVNRQFGDNLPFEVANKEEILKRALLGGYPVLEGKSSKLRREWFKNYLKAIIEKDLSDVGAFRKKDAISALLHGVSAFSSRLVNFSEVAQATDLDQRTVKNYIQALQTMYLIDEVPAWKKRPGVKFGSQSKWFVTDTGLMSFLQGHNDYESFSSWVLMAGKVGSDFVGNLVETCVYTQLAPCVELSSEWKIFHIRAAQKYEIDFLLERESGQKIAIEVKSSDRVSKSDFNNIEWFRKICQDQRIQGVLLYAGNEVMEYDNGDVALPIAKFWQS